MEQLGHALSVVAPADHLPQNLPNVDYDFLALRLVLVLRERVRHDQLLQVARLHLPQCISAQM